MRLVEVELVDLEQVVLARVEIKAVVNPYFVGKLAEG